VMNHRRKAWVVMVVAFAASVTAAINRFKVPSVLPVLMDDLQIGMVTAGWLASAFSITSIILTIPVALVLSRLGLKTAGLIAMGCSSLGAIVGALAPNATTLLLGGVIEGISFSLMSVLTPTVISEWFEPQERGLPMGIWAAWVPVGNVIMFNVAHPLLSVLGWRLVWWFGASLALVVGVLYGLIVTSPPGSPQRQKTPPRSFGRMLLNPLSWLLGLAFGAFGFSLIGYNTWVSPFLTETLSIDPASASFFASLMFLAAIPASAIAGWVITRIKNRHSLLPVVFLITGLLFVWSFRLRDVRAVVPYMLVLGFVSNFVPATIFTLAPETMPSPEFTGLAVAIVVASSTSGSLGGPPILGAVVSAGGWIAGSVCFVVAMGLGTIIAWYVSARLSRKAPAPSALPAGWTA
jgi:predicted MFS family arabinose efflux permease